MWFSWKKGNSVTIDWTRKTLCSAFPETKKATNFTWNFSPICLQTKCHLISKMQYVPLIRVGQMGGASILPDPTQPNWPNGFLPYSATPLSGDHLPLTPISDHISYVHFCFLSVSMWYSLQNCPFFNFFCLSSWRKFDSLFSNFCKVYFPWMWQNLTFQLYSSILRTGYSGVISRC